MSCPKNGTVWFFTNYSSNVSKRCRWNSKQCTVQILCIGTDRSQQTVQTKIRLLLKKQSDQGLRCLSFNQHLLDALMQCYIKLFYFRTIMTIVWGVPNFRIFTVDSEQSELGLHCCLIHICVSTWFRYLGPFYGVKFLSYIWINMVYEKWRLLSEFHSLTTWWCFEIHAMHQVPVSLKGESAVGPTHISDSLLRRCLSAVSVRSFR